MEKKIVKVQEQTDKKIEKKTDSGDFLQKVKDGNNRPIPIIATKRILLDRGDSKKLKPEGAQIKYDATKINKAVEANFRSIRQSTNGNKNGAQIKKNNSNPQSTDVEHDAKLLKSHKNSTKAEQDADVKTKDNLRINGGKNTGGKRVLEKEPSLRLRQTSAITSDREARNQTKDDGRNRVKVKEVITIPYTLIDDPAPDVDENISLKLQRSPKLGSNVAKSKAVTFTDRNERSPKIAKRESKKPDGKSSSVKTHSGKKRRRKNNSPSSIKNGINEALPTEVVKWSPSSVNNHTKPYYEAWVDRSLTAFSKCSEKERLKLEREINETLKYFKRPASPELTYERMNDEAYTGRIKVRRG